MRHQNYQFLQLPSEIAVKIREKYLLKGSFLVKLQASSLMSKKITKIMHEWSLVINLFWWLTIQTTFKIDSIPCNCVCIFKTFSKQYCLDYYIKRKKCSSFTETCRYFEDLAFCLFNISELKRFNFPWHLINICLLHSHFCSNVGIFLPVLAA